MRIGRKILLLRKERGLALRAVEENTHLSSSFLSDMEHGRTDPSLGTIAKLARCFGLSIAELLEGVDVEGVVGVASGQLYPPELGAFLEEMSAAGTPVPRDLVDLMRHARSLRPGRQELQAEDWQALYYGLWTLVHKER